MRSFRSMVIHALLGAVLLVGLSGGVASAMRCGTRLVSRGDGRAKVLALCGRPLDVQRRVLYAFQRAGYGGFWGVGYHLPIVVEVWVYNLGPNRLMRELIFQNGTMLREDTVGYGFSPGQAGPNAQWLSGFPDPAFSPSPRR